MNTLRISSLSAAVLLASMSGLCFAQADMAVAANTTTDNTRVAVTMQHNTIQPASANTNVSASSESAVSAETTAQNASGQNTSDQNSPDQNTASQTALAGSLATDLSQSVLEQPAVALAQTTNITQQSSTVVSALLTPPTATMPELPSADPVAPTELPALPELPSAELPAVPELANESAQAAISQTTSTLVQQQVSTELTKAVDDTIKAEVANSVQSSLNSVLSLGL